MGLFKFFDQGRVSKINQILVWNRKRLCRGQHIYPPNPMHVMYTLVLGGGSGQVECLNSAHMHHINDGLIYYWFVVFVSRSGTAEQI